MAGAGMTDPRRGRSAPEATAAAVAEFGDPHTVAVAFGPELAAARARRVALGLLATGPMVGLTWIAAAVAASAATTADLTLLAMITGHALTTSGPLRWAPVVLAVVASLTRGTLAALAARRCLGARAALS